MNTIQSLGRLFSGQMGTPHLFNAPVIDCPFVMHGGVKYSICSKELIRPTCIPNGTNVPCSRNRVLLNETPIYHVHIAYPACPYGKPETCRSVVFDGPFDSNDQWQICAGLLENNQEIRLRILFFCCPTLIALDQSVLRDGGVMNNPGVLRLPDNFIPCGVVVQLSKRARRHYI